jgi:hypothetical protein
VFCKDLINLYSNILVLDASFSITNSFAHWIFLCFVSDHDKSNRPII